MGSKGGSSLPLSQQVCAEVCSGPDPGQREGQAWILALQGAHGAGGTERELPVRNQHAVRKRPGPQEHRGAVPTGLGWGRHKRLQRSRSCPDIWALHPSSWTAGKGRC